MDEILPKREEEGGTKREGERVTGGSGRRLDWEREREREERVGERYLSPLTLVLKD